MDRGKRKGNVLGTANHKIYMDLKDIIREHTLAYLPAKSLMRFQSVCRDWKHQIASPFFAHNQSQNYRPVLGLFCQAPGKPPVFIPFDAKSCGMPDPLLNFLPEPVEIRSSSNGLLCCQSSSGKAYYICNPVTKQWKKLPEPNADHGSNPAIVLLFEPSLLNFVAEYKLVCAFRSNDFEDAIEFEVYNSVEDSWKISGEICFKTGTPIPSSAVHVNNVVYWKLDSHGYILAFDLVKDRSQRVYGNNGILVNMNNKLASAMVYNRSVHLSVLANIHTNTMQMSTKVRMWEEKPAVLKNLVDGDQKVVFVSEDMVVTQGCSTLHLCFLKENSRKEVMQLDKHEKRNFIPYVNSLVSI